MFVSDGGNYILDCAFGAIADADALAATLAACPASSTTGCSSASASAVIVAGADGVEVLQPNR